jgi:hypothetical protein
MDCASRGNPAGATFTAGAADDRVRDTGGGPAGVSGTTRFAGCALAKGSAGAAGARQVEGAAAGAALATGAPEAAETAAITAVAALERAVSTVAAVAATGAAITNDICYLRRPDEFAAGGDQSLLSERHRQGKQHANCRARSVRQFAEIVAPLTRPAQRDCHLQPSPAAPAQASVAKGLVATSVPSARVDTSKSANTAGATPTSWRRHSMASRRISTSACSLARIATKCRQAR